MKTQRQNCGGLVHSMNAGTFGQSLAKYSGNRLLEASGTTTIIQMHVVRRG
ncbi:MAG: hypothetical protein KDA58_07220 [Planctomycetaceae bacterium]|nr:hypothetical protein [Planctomycetaceae bacterium]